MAEGEEPGSNLLSCQINKLADWLKGDRVYSGHLVERHLHHVLSGYTTYYNHARTHFALGKYAPNGRLIETEGAITAILIFGRIHHRYAQMV